MEDDLSMCGLIFLHAPDLPKSESERNALNALYALKHRGPDALQLKTNGLAVLAHARLSIVGLNDSHQPMCSPDGRYTLIFNGEIYNYRELRSDLAKHWVFRTQGDTEVLLAGLILRDCRFLECLSGMWAFALWDSRDQRLLLSRDRMGEKPLYYSTMGDRFAAASELPALKHLSKHAWQEDIDSVADYFRYGYCLPGHTMWAGVFEVLPAHVLEWHPGKNVVQRQYWQLPLPLPRSNSNPTEAIEKLKDTLESAVKTRLVADVEVGSFLSGGIDSSLICALAQDQMDRPLKTYTISFTDQTYDESRHAASVAAKVGTDHHVERFSKLDESVLETLLSKHLGQAFSDSSLLPTSLVSQVAAHDVKVALSGDGADELFGGYQRYQARMILRWYTRLPAGLRHLAENALRALPENGKHHSHSWLKKAHLFVDIAQRQQAEIPYTAPLMFHPDQYARLFPELVGHGHTPHGLQAQTTLGDLQQMLVGDALIYLPQDILTKVDRASMAHGLETRAPFLDHKVVELAFSISADQHIGIGYGKRLLRRTFSNCLPASIWKRRKQGFAVPIHQWFREELGKKLSDELDRSRGALFDTGIAKQLLAEHTRGIRDHGHRLWMIHVYNIFRQE